MKNIVLLFVFGIAAALCGCTVVGNGVAQEKSFTSIPITELEVSGPWQVQVVCNAPENKCVVTADENIWRSISIRKKTDFRAQVSGKVNPAAPLSIVIHTTDNVSGVKLSKNARAAVSNNSPSRCEIEADDTCVLVMSGKSIDVVDAELEDTASMKFTGRIGTLNLEASDAATFQAEKVVVGNLKLEDNSSVALENADDLNIRMYDDSKLDVVSLFGVIRGKAKNSAAICYGGEGHTMLQSTNTVVVGRRK